MGFCKLKLGSLSPFEGLVSRGRAWTPPIPFTSGGVLARRLLTHQILTGPGSQSGPAPYPQAQQP